MERLLEVKWLSKKHTKTTRMIHIPVCEILREKIIPTGN